MRSGLMPAVWSVLGVGFAFALCRLVGLDVAEILPWVIEWALGIAVRLITPCPPRGPEHQVQVNDLVPRNVHIVGAPIRPRASDLGARGLDRQRIGFEHWPEIAPGCVPQLLDRLVGEIAFGPPFRLVDAPRHTILSPCSCTLDDRQIGYGLVSGSSRVTAGRGVDPRPAAEASALRSRNTAANSCGSWSTPLQVFDTRALSNCTLHGPSQLIDHIERRASPTAPA